MRQNELPHAAPKATEASAPEATEAATAAPCRIARTRTHGYAVTREADHKRKPKRRYPPLCFPNVSRSLFGKHPSQ